MKTQEQIRIKTPGKINPYLHVLARRPDGYHDLAMAMAPITLYDSLLIDCSLPEGLVFESAGRPLPVEPGENLVHRAAKLFTRATGRPRGLRIRLEKRIPSGAGLGGGSGNAAGTLMALNHLCGEPLSPGELRAMALELGSDVPFFLDPRPSLARGRGEGLTALADFPRLWLVVVKPGFAMATGEAYGLVRPRPGRPLPRLGATVESVAAALENDFEAPLIEHQPELGLLKSRLLGLGAAGVLLCGSGSAMFGLFSDAALRGRAAEALAENDSWEVLPCETVNSHSYLPAPE